uniref:Uncharacterized protein n=1 Tax=Oryza rufipogon TaxID=4529 RepID=A0A0E0NY50_ORYRU
MSARDADTGEPPAKRRAIDPIAPTVHPWNLPAGIPLLHCSSRPASLQPHSTRYKLFPGDTIIGLGRQSREPFGLQANRGIYSVERWADLPRICPEMQRVTFINTFTAIGGPAINKNGSVIGILFHSLSFTPFLPSNVILKWWEYFKTTGKYCCPMISFVGCNLHNGRSSRWVNVPTSLHEGLDGILVEMASRELLSAGLQEKYLIIRCNGKRVTTRLQLFEVLVENIGQIVEPSDGNRMEAIDGGGEAILSSSFRAFTVRHEQILSLARQLNQEQCLATRVTVQAAC